MKEEISELEVKDKSENIIQEISEQEKADNEIDRLEYEI